MSRVDSAYALGDSQLPSRVSSTRMLFRAKRQQRRLNDPLRGQWTGSIRRPTGTALWAIQALPPARCRTVTPQRLSHTPA